MTDSNSSYTRRRLIQTGGAGAVAAALAASPVEAKNHRKRHKADVIVVGAG
ncbi:MAG: hypothetical protein QOH38_326 [Thermoleophilaceae bacterium]|nr:hypothetical protein [Thermoleophilaceae bacterium]